MEQLSVAEVAYKLRSLDIPEFLVQLLEGETHGIVLSIEESK